MIRIITYEKCDKCGKKYKDIYISFKHPDKDFTSKWECECGHTNERLIKAIARGDIEWINRSKSFIEGE